VLRQDHERQATSFPGLKFAGQVNVFECDGRARRADGGRLNDGDRELPGTVVWVTVAVALLAISTSTCWAVKVTVAVLRPRPNHRSCRDVDAGSESATPSSVVIVYVRNSTLGRVAEAVINRHALDPQSQRGGSRGASSRRRSLEYC
jgi:hypothetical protein